MSTLPIFLFWYYHSQGMSCYNVFNWAPNCGNDMEQEWRKTVSAHYFLIFWSDVQASAKTLRNNMVSSTQLKYLQNLNCSKMCMLHDLVPNFSPTLGPTIGLIMFVM